MSDKYPSRGDAPNPVPFARREDGTFIHLNEYPPGHPRHAPGITARMADGVPADFEMAALTELVLCEVKRVCSVLSIDLRFAPRVLTAVALAIATHHPPRDGEPT